MIPGRGDDGVWDRGKIGIGAYPEGIVGEDPLVNILMAEPDTQRIQTLPGKAVFWWEQADGWFYSESRVQDGKGRRRAYKTLKLRCWGSNASLRVTGSQILRCKPPALKDKEKV